MRRVFILTCLSVCVTALPTRDEKEAKTEPDVFAPKADAIGAVGKITDGPTLEANVDKITEEELKNVPENLEGREASEEKKGAPRSTIHIHTQNPPNINLMPNKYQINNIQPQFGSKPGPPPTAYQAQGQNGNKKKKDEPYNQVNVYVYFPKDVNGIKDDTMVVNSYASDGSSTSYLRNKNQDSKIPEPCPAGQVKIKGVCIEYDQRRKKML